VEAAAAVVAVDAGRSAATGAVWRCRDERRPVQIAESGRLFRLAAVLDVPIARCDDDGSAVDEFAAAAGDRWPSSPSASPTAAPSYVSRILRIRRPSPPTGCDVTVGYAVVVVVVVAVRRCGDGEHAQCDGCGSRARCGVRLATVQGGFARPSASDADKLVAGCTDRCAFDLITLSTLQVFFV